ncbi:aldo/keto reductase, partial [Klebsiella pneumoniae]
VGFVPYSPLGRGFLTGTITDPGVLAADDFRRHLPRFQAETMRKNQLLLERLQQVATRYDATLAQIALAWVMSKGEDIVPIPGARKIAHLRDNAGAANITLAPEDILTIEHIFTADNVTGLRYTQGDFDLIEK